MSTAGGLLICIDRSFCAVLIGGSSFWYKWFEDPRKIIVTYPSLAVV